MLTRIAALAAALAIFCPCLAQANAARTCARVVAPLDYSAQLWDLGNTVRGFRRGFVEVDPLVAPFTGPSHNDIRGEVLEGAAFDLLMLQVTRRSPALRCAWQGADALAHLSAIFYTNGWRVHGTLFGVRW